MGDDADWYRLMVKSSLVAKNEEARGIYVGDKMISESRERVVIKRLF